MRGRREGERKKGRERKGVCVCGGSLIGLDWLQHESLICPGMIKSVIRTH